MYAYDTEVFGTFEYSISRARALIAIQDGIDLLVEISEYDGTMWEYLKDKYPGTSPLINFYSNFFDVIPDKIEESVEENVKKVIKDNELEMKESLEKIQGRDLEKAFSPFIEMIQSAGMMYQYPLYYESVVSSVTAFEAYLRDTLVELITYNIEIEERFHQELSKGINYETVKKYKYNYDSMIGRVAIDHVRFFNLNDVDSYFQRAFGKSKEDFSIFQNDKQKKLLQNFLYLRNIIVHNGGRVDEEFKDKVGYRGSVGDHFTIKKKYLIDRIGSIIKVVDHIETIIEETLYNGEDKS